MFDHAGFDQLTLGSWVIIGEHCSVRRAPLRREDYLTYIFESGGVEFELAMAPSILRAMVELGAQPPPGPERSDT
ncbi:MULTISPECIES: hypothetical protein [Nocardia]|uniref:Uncharacterized protein n=1 Tax=Nocardia aurea TaxID=2144174 RepID=A0ABV3G6C7_9NOCA|nr:MULTISPECIES: hypothetical protein [Nocardia]